MAGRLDSRRSRFATGRHLRRPRRVIALFLVAIVSPTLALLYLGLTAVRRQRDAIEGLTAAAHRSRIARVAEALEHTVAAQARACLRDGRVAVSVDQTKWDAPESRHALRRTLDEVCAAHPVCADLVVVTAADVGVPLLDEPLPRHPSSVVTDRTDVDASRATARLSVAAMQEHAGEWPSALTTYQSLTNGARDPRLVALAYAGIARVRAASGDVEGATRAWARVASRYPDAYDLAQRPLGVVATIEAARLGKAADTSREFRQRLAAQTRHQFAEARWAVSPGQAGYFAAKLDEAAGQPLDWETSRLFEQFAIAAHVRRRLPWNARDAGEIQATTLPGSRPHQLFHTTPGGTGTTPAVVVMDVDLVYVDATMLTATSRANGIDALREIPLRLVSSGGEPSPFRDAFPFLTLAPRAAAPRPRWWTSEIVVFTGTTAGVLSVLVLGVVLLARDVSRDVDTARLRSELVSGVSHELRTPLSIIRLYAESLADISGETGAEQQVRQSRVILHESERLTHLVERVLEFSQLEAGGRSYDLELHAPAALARAFVNKYEPYLAHLGFALTTEFDEDAPPIRADSGAVTQALLNLVDNAAKYAGNTAPIVLRVIRRDADVVMEVEDRGPGVPSQERARLFEAFFRGRQTSGRGGYGLGLHLVSHIMRAHGGTVDIDAPVAGGCCFRLVFPAAPERDA